MSTLGDIAQIAAPALTAGAGAWWAARSSVFAAHDTELRSIVDEAAQVLERADQRRGRAYVLFVSEGADTSDKGLDAIRAFRQELSTAAQLRDRLAFRTGTDDPVYAHYKGALEGLGEVSTTLGVAAVWQSAVTVGMVQRWDGVMKESEATFKRERELFLDASNKRLSPKRFRLRKP